MGEFRQGVMAKPQKEGCLEERGRNLARRNLHQPSHRIRSL